VTLRATLPRDSHPPKPVTPWAFASVLCSLAVFCPVLTLVGPVLGIKALAEIRLQPGLGGRGLATAGIVIGLAVTLTWGAIALWWQVTVRTPLIDGPIAEIQALQRGEIDRFRNGFVGEAAMAGEDEILAFAGQMAQRYGLLLRIEQDPLSDIDPVGEHRFEARVPYVFHFETGTVRSVARFEVRRLRSLRLGAGWRSMTLFDEQRGDITFPAERP
jgi:hypothetical protein